MARITNLDRDKKMLEGKSLFIKNFSFQSISDIINISVDTLKKWAKDENWNAAKKMHSISINELKQEILETFHALKTGKKPKLTSDEISKLAAAFEKLSDKKKHLTYMYHCFEELTEALAEEVTMAKGKDREYKLQRYKEVRLLMEKLTEKKYKEALND